MWRLRDALITGHPGSAFSCPIARYVASRIREHLTPNDEVAVSVCRLSVRAAIHFTDGSQQELDVPTPEPVREFISTFDTYGPLGKTPPCDKA